MEELLNTTEKLSVNELELIVAEQITSAENYSRSFWPNLVAPQTYRARLHNHLEGRMSGDTLHRFTNEGEYWNPPQDFIYEYGRCNDINESLFYCTNSWETAISEVRPETGQYVSVATFKVKSEDLGSRISPIGMQYLSQIDSLREGQFFKDYNIQVRSAAFLKLDTYLDDLFHMPVADNEKHKYKLSIAVTKCLMKNIQMGEAIHAMHGIMYSSIIRNKQNYNLLLRPSHARHIYSLFQVQTFLVSDANDDKIKVQLLRNGMTMGTKHHPFDNFEMHWELVDEGPEAFEEVART